MVKTKMKKDIKMTAIITVFIVVAAVLTIFVVGSVRESARLRQFKSDVFMLCRDTNVCRGMGEDGLVKIDAENLPAINALVSASKGKIVKDNPEAVESISLEFDCDGSTWTMVIDKIDNDIVRMVIDGERSYTVYLDNGGSFEKYKMVVSLKGINAKNKPIG